MSVVSTNMYICPRCGRRYKGFPLLSLVDYQLICPDCNFMEQYSNFHNRTDTNFNNSKFN